MISRDSGNNLKSLSFDPPNGTPREKSCFIAQLGLTNKLHPEMPVIMVHVFVEGFYVRYDPVTFVFL